MTGLVGVPHISVLPSECLFGRFKLDFGFWAEDVIVETFAG